MANEEELLPRAYQIFLMEAPVEVSATISPGRRALPMAAQFA